jgi:hypothetical protein
VAGLASFLLDSNVQLGDGSSTAFWLDLWLGPTPSMNASLPCSLTLLDNMPRSLGSSLLAFSLILARTFRMWPTLISELYLMT